MHKRIWTVFLSAALLLTLAAPDASAWQQRNEVAHLRGPCVPL